MPTDPNVMRALNLFNKGFNCSQFILAAFAKDFGMDEVQALKLAAGLGGGMGSTARTCGAVTGAFLVIGLKYGSHKAEDKDSKAKTYAKVREFIEEFEKKRGSIECKQLVGIDISSETGFAEARDKKLFKTICPEVVEEAEAILRKCL
jgi:C_GCAxxG_C_C family probable redox protein